MREAMDSTRPVRWPALREEPYRLLLPIGALLAGAGVLPWLAFALGLSAVYRPVFQSVMFRSMFHPLAEVEGFCTCFAFAFLFTLLPRRTGTAPPARWQIAVAAAGPIAVVVCTLFGRWAIAQIGWLFLLGVAVEFSLRRMRRRTEPLPPVFLWAGAGVAMGAAGAVLAGAGAEAGGEWLWLHEVGRGLLLQGLLTGLALGTTTLLVPAARVAPARRLPGLLLHALGAVALCASFFVGQLVSARLAFAIRAVVTLAVVGGSLHLPLKPTAPGLRRGMARLSVWMMPVGNAWIALAPAYRRAGLHVVYLGCFTALLLAAAVQLAPQPETLPEPQLARPLHLPRAAALLALALAARILLEMDPPNFHLWLGLASASFLTATIPWLAPAPR